MWSSRFSSETLYEIEGERWKSCVSFLQFISLDLLVISGSFRHHGFKRKTVDVETSDVEHIDSPVIIQPLRGGSDPYILHRSLYKLRPRFIVMYDCDVAFIRQVIIVFFRNHGSFNAI